MANKVEKPLEKKGLGRFWEPGTCFDFWSTDPLWIVFGWGGIPTQMWVCETPTPHSQFIPPKAVLRVSDFWCEAIELENNSNNFGEGILKVILVSRRGGQVSLDSLY